jgi:diketogulonate reductase-like aldo/keto reductase
MGFLGAAFRVFCYRVVPVLVLSTALFIGWLNQEIIPEGRLFATAVPLLKGVMPPSIVGHGQMVGTPPVPDDMTPEPRPENEMFLELPGGYQMPQNGLGMCCRPTAYDDVLVERTVLWYLLIGGRLIDTAHVYLNHRAIGKGIKEAIRRGVPRSEIFVTTKVFPSLYGYNSTKEIVPKFLDELGLEYIDLVILHSPVRFPGLNYMSEECNTKKLSKEECRHETFQALSEFREQDGDGLIRNVGVSNFNTLALKELQKLDGAAPIANNQIMFNPFAPNESVDTFQFCQQNDISITAFFSLGGSYQHQEAQTIATLKTLSEKYDRSVAQIMLRWSLQVNAAIIPGTGNPKHMRENLSIYSFELSKEDMNEIDKLRSDGTADKFMKMEPMD